MVREGAFADLVILNAETVAEGSSFAKPTIPAIGIEIVIVNGEVVWENEAVTERRPGRVLRRVVSVV